MIHTITNYPIVEMAVIASIMALMGAIVLIGRGDFLIAGYNTASKQKKEKVNIKRLRLVIACICWISAVFCMLIIFMKTELQLLLLTFGFVAIVLLGIVLANTWAKKK